MSVAEPESGPPAWTVGDLSSDPLPRWSELLRLYTSDLGTHSSNDLEKVRARYLAWSAATLETRTAALLLGTDALPPKFDEDTYTDWVPPWVASELRPAWKSWRDALYAVGDIGAANAAAQSSGSPAALLRPQLNIWRDAVRSVIATSAGSSAVVVAPRSQTENAAGQSSLLVHQLLEHILSATDRACSPGVAVCRLRGAATLLAARTTLSGAGVLLMTDSGGSTVQDLAQSLDQASVEQLARFSDAATTTGPVRTVRWN